MKRSSFDLALGVADPNGWPHSTSTIPRVAMMVGVLCIASYLGCQRAPAPVSTAADLFVASSHLAADTVNEDDRRWTKAVTPRPFHFPADHGSHEDFRIEWWYYTGNLQSSEGRRFGYQLTFFRTGLHQEPQNPSRWAIRNLYTGHFAISDIDRERHLQAQRNNRGALAQAGADSEALRVWNGNWSVIEEAGLHKLVASHQGNQLELRLTPQKPPIAHGDDGLSQKGAAEGNASYYYSFTNMQTAGQLVMDGEIHEVTGQSWMDHEFSTSFLEPGQLGWDWFAIQLDNDTELMLYRMRRDDGSADPFSSGSFIKQNGERVALAASDFTLTPKRYWTSPESEGEYPISWEIQIPQLDCRLEAQSAFEDQEMRTGDTTGITYWEGAITVAGQLHNEMVKGRGYLELTGYVGIGLGSLLD